MMAGSMAPNFIWQMFWPTWKSGSISLPKLSYQKMACGEEWMKKEHGMGWSGCWFREMVVHRSKNNLDDPSKPKINNKYFKFYIHNIIEINF